MLLWRLHIVSHVVASLKALADWEEVGVLMASVYIVHIHYWTAQGPTAIYGHKAGPLALAWSESAIRPN